MTTNTNITAAMVKELRERTGAGMMECKKALVDVGGDMEAAVETLRKSGQAKADKKAGRVAAEGLIGVALSDDGKSAAMVEVNCETDFVAKEKDLHEFAAAAAARVLSERPADVEALGALPMVPGDERTVDVRRRELIATIGENISLRRCIRLESASGSIGSYIHGQRIGVLVEVSGGDEQVAKDIAMHVAASRPVCIGENSVPADLIAKEREIFEAQAADSGKPPEIVAKMVNGRIRKYLGEITLLGQPFVKEPDLSVQKYLAQSGANVTAFERFEVGEGIEKKAENFADEVMAQVRAQD